MGKGLLPSLYFRRWTRSHAAVFRSLGRCVVIGHLAASVLEQIAGKSLSILRQWSPLQLAAEAPSQAEDEQTCSSEELALLLEELPCLPAVASTLACGSPSTSIPKS